jgi:hypothetical protein
MLKGITHIIPLMDTLISILTKQKRMIKMRKLTMELTETEMNVTSWDFEVNSQNIGYLLKQQLKQGKFIGNIKIVITETQTIVEEDTENDN